MNFGGLGGNGKGHGPMGKGQRRSAGLFGKEQLKEAEKAQGSLPGHAPDAVRRSPGCLRKEACGVGCACAPAFLPSLSFIVWSRFASPNFPSRCEF